MLQIGLILGCQSQQKINHKMPEYIFIRKEGFYLITLKSPISEKTDDEFVIDNVKSNPGTLKVIRISDNKQIYPLSLKLVK